MLSRRFVDKKRNTSKEAPGARLGARPETVLRNVRIVVGGSVGVELTIVVILDQIAVHSWSLCENLAEGVVFRS